MTGECVQTLEGHTDAVNWAQFSPDGQMIVSASGDPYATGGSDNSVRIWNALTGECVHTLEGHTDSVNSAQFSPDGRKIVSASGNPYATGDVSDCDNSVRIWNALTGENVETLHGHASAVLTAQFSPDGQKIVSASVDQTVRIW